MQIIDEMHKIYVYSYKKLHFIDNKMTIKGIVYGDKRS